MAAKARPCPKINTIAQQRGPLGHPQTLWGLPGDMRGQRPLASHPSPLGGPRNVLVVAPGQGSGVCAAVDSCVSHAPGRCTNPPPSTHTRALYGSTPHD